MLNPIWFSVPDNRHNIETVLQVNPVLYDIGLCSTQKILYLLSVNRISRTAILLTGTAFDLDKDQCIAILGNNIDLFMSASPIIMVHYIPFIKKIAGCKHLSFVP